MQQSSFSKKPKAKDERIEVGAKEAFVWGKALAGLSLDKPGKLSFWFGSGNLISQKARPPLVGTDLCLYIHIISVKKQTDIDKPEYVCSACDTAL